jgi:OOP family OmpA-OmpF porin
MKAIYRAALMIAAFVFLLPLSARSEIKAGSFEVGPFGGYNFFEKGQNLENRPVYGGRLGYNFTRHFGIEGAGEFINSRVDDKAKTADEEGQFGRPMDGVDSTFYHLDLVYHFKPDGKFNPFILAGFGGAHYSPEISTRDMAAFNVGVGAKYWLTDNIALRFDLQDYMVTEIFQETYHNIGVTIGITFAFGGKAKRATSPVAKYEPIPESKPEPESRPTPPPPPPPEPRVEEKVVILASEPKVEEKVVAAVSETKAEEKIIILAFEDVHFDFDKSTLKPEAQTILKRNIQLLKDNPKAQIRIAGYTSASGTEAYNQKLSERRANAVQEYLINEGVITRDRLSTIGYGETNPAMYEAAPKELYSKAAKANMRVLFEIIVQ